MTQKHLGASKLTAALDRLPSGNVTPDKRKLPLADGDLGRSRPIWVLNVAMS